MRYIFLTKFVLKTAIFLAILVLIINAFYDSTNRNRHSKQSITEKSQSILQPQQHSAEHYDFHYFDTSNYEISHTQDGNGEEEQNLVTKSPFKPYKFNSSTTDVESGTGIKNSPGIREEDYMDYEQVVHRRIITDRYFDLINRYTFNNDQTGKFNLFKKEFVKSWKTQPLTLNKTMLEKSLGSLWRPEKSPEMDQDDRIVSQLIWQMEAANNSQLKSDKVKKIYIFDKFKWWGNKDWPNQKKIDKCVGGFNKCLLTENINSLNEVDAVITVRDMFHTRDLITPKNVLKINFILESPFASTATLYGKNELLASYWRGSDIVTPYSKWVYYEPTVRRMNQKKNYSSGKTKSVAIFMSNCHAMNNRLNYVRALQKHIKVDIYGDCGTESCPRSDANSCFQMLNKDYRFYLAFENANCRDYITEKFFENALKNNVIPVVLGPHPEDLKTSAPYGSYIHVEDFDSPQELAVYLKYLEENPEEYNKYFEWKGTGQFITLDFFCRVCSMVHYASLYPPPERDKPFIWHDKQSNICLRPGRWYWTKPNHPDGSLTEIL